MPRADGSIPPVRVPELPWQQKFKPFDRVRVVDTGERSLPYPGAVGIVVEHGDQEWYPVLVDLGYGGVAYNPGELRPVTS